jgi:hypothetical protein
MVQCTIGTVVPRGTMYHGTRVPWYVSLLVHVRAMYGTTIIYRYNVMSQLSDGTLASTMVHVYVL